MEIKYKIKLLINNPTLNIVGSIVFNTDSIDSKNLGMNWFKKANKKVHPNTTTNNTILPFSLPSFNWKGKDRANNNKAVDKIINVSMKPLLLKQPNIVTNTKPIPIFIVVVMSVYPKTSCVSLILIPSIYYMR